MMDGFILRSFGAFHSGFGKVLGDKEDSQRLVTTLRPKPLDQLLNLEEQNVWTSTSILTNGHQSNLYCLWMFLDGIRLDQMYDYRQSIALLLSPWILSLSTFIKHSSPRTSLLFLIVRTLSCYEGDCCCAPLLWRYLNWPPFPRPLDSLVLLII